MSTNEGRKILVVGGACGMGAATVAALYRQGANLVVLDINEEAMEELIEDEELTEGPGTLHFVAGDVNDTSVRQEAIDYAKANRVALAFLDIELGKTNGLELCRALLDINPRTNVVYLTAYSGYSLEAWDTGASGFMLKPITPEGVQAQLRNLRYPFHGGVGR